MQMIECRDVTKDFGNRFGRKVRALDSVCLTVQRGEIFGLLGPNGAGKTTLVKVLLGLVLPSEGTAAVDGRDVRDYRARTTVGYLPENPNFPTYLRGRQLLELFAGLSAVAPERRRARAGELLTLVNLQEGAGRKVGGYSKGMVQRIGLAQALVGEPDLVFLDEPTDGVDPIGRRDIRDILVGLTDAGTTVFLNSHLLSEIEMLCDRVAVMDGGRILAEGSLADLTSDAGRFSIACNGTGDLTDADLRAAAPDCSLRDGVIEVRVESAEQLNRVIDLLRSRQVLITAVTPLRKTLETYFIDLITDIRGKRIEP